MKTYGLSKLGIKPSACYRNLNPSILVEKALARGEGQLTDTGALNVLTGKYTGRSPKDKFIVDSKAVHDKIAWGSVNMPTKRKVFNEIKKNIEEYLCGKEVFVFDGFAGADPKYTRKFRIVCELASQALFINDLLIRPTAEELEAFGDPDFTLIAAPGYKVPNPEELGINSEAAIMIDYEKKMVIIAGSQYAGEIKKSVFSVMNFLMPEEENILPMHCSANMDPDTGDRAVFFGLSGTGKTTLSADPNRALIGDDEHGWSSDGVFNFEGGCYAKCIDLEEEREPEIFHAIKFGAVSENLIVDPDTRKPDYTDGSLTENTRVGYPINFISNAKIPGYGGIPKVVIFLTADAFGVLPPISKLSRDAAMYQFVTGFTAKVAGTERGITEPVPTFSTLFGEPFMPCDPSLYAEMLGERLDKYGTQVYLVNTGWSGGPYGVGHRMKLSYTRAMVTAALNGSLKDVEYKHDDRFNVEIPLTCPEVPSEILDPKQTWADKDAYDEQAQKLAEMFVENFQKKYAHMPEEITNAGPKPL